MNTSQEYLQTLVDSKELVVVYVKLDDGNGQTVYIQLDNLEKEISEKKSNEKKYIGKIKESLEDGIVLEKSERFNEIFINIDYIIAVRKWTSRES